MADTLEITIKEYSDIKNEYAYWKGKWEVLKSLYENGKQPILINAKFVFDTLADAIGEICDPDHDVLNFAAPQQIYIRSSEAADESISCYVIGQKADGTFGLFELTTSDGAGAADGTTPVDCGTWNVIFCAIKKDAAAGNLIIDDDGASTTVFFTMALGATVKEGIIHVPDGYYGAILESKLQATGVAGFVPTDTADTVPDVVMMEIGDEVRNYIDMNHPISINNGNKIFDEQEQIKLEAEYENAVIGSIADIWIVLWAKPSNA